MMARQFPEQVDVARYQPVLCDDRHWVSEFRQHFEATARDPQLSLDRLVRIGHAAHDKDLRFPFRRGEFLFEQFRRVLFHHDLALEIQPGRQPEIFMGGPRETIDAAMLATAVRIYARLEPDVRAVVPRDDRFRLVAKELRLAPRPLFFFAGRIDLDHVRIAEIDMQLFKPVRRIPGSASSMDRRRGRGRFLHDRDKLLFCSLLRTGHCSSSHEHIWLSNASSASCLRGRLAEGVGFEPTRACALPVFKTGAINHSTTPPVGEAEQYFRAWPHRQLCSSEPSSRSQAADPASLREDNPRFLDFSRNDKDATIVVTTTAADFR